jgi:hypothetical protein
MVRAEDMIPNATFITGNNHPGFSCQKIQETIKRFIISLLPKINRKSYVRSIRMKVNGFSVGRNASNDLPIYRTQIDPDATHQLHKWTHRLLLHVIPKITPVPRHQVMPTNTELR